ncbi:MAG: hypothetical protein V1861_03070 [Candidatus Micrarchaeota archaeon]
MGNGGDERNRVIHRAAKKLASLVLAGTLSSCLPLFEPAYGTSIQYATDCYGYICRQAALIRTTRPVHEGDTVEGGRVWSSVSYRGWIISRIGDDGVELIPSESSAERVLIPYGGQESVESRSPNPYNFESSLVFEKGLSPGTAIMTIVEKPY